MPINVKPAQLPEELGMYVDDLRRRVPQIGEVWLLGPRVNDEHHRGSDWDLLAFADEAALRTIRSDPSLHRDDLHLSVVTDGDRFRPAWAPAGGDGGEGRLVEGRLADLDWRVEDLHVAHYTQPSGRRETAVRVR